MADDDSPGSPSIPKWQQSSTSQAIDPLSESKVVHESEGSIRKDGFTREEVVRFMEDPVVKDASDDKKISFLESKGVSRELVDDILREQAVQADPALQQQPFDVAQFKSQTAVPTRDAPPIVTYPEFLVKPQKPPPLVTMGRLLNTAYIACSLATAFYGVSKYVVEPMTATLTEARHEFASHARERIENLNEKLQPRVSKLPDLQVLNEAAADLESVTSDPTELFYHDVGVQTSPPESRRASSSDSSMTMELSSRSSTSGQEVRLNRLKAHLDGLLEAEVSNRDVDSKFSTSVQDLREYLSGLVYAPPATLEYGMWSMNGSTDKTKRDAVSALRDEIRGVKGVMLSARRFPTFAPSNPESIIAARTKP